MGEAQRRLRVLDRELGSEAAGPEHRKLVVRHLAVADGIELPALVGAAAAEKLGSEGTARRTSNGRGLPYEAAVVTTPPTRAAFQMTSRHASWRRIQRLSSHAQPSRTVLWIQ